MAGFLFLTVVLDAWSWRIVGWAVSTDLGTRICEGETEWPSYSTTTVGARDGDPGAHPAV